ncbi:MAG: glucose-1-phosphate adenylyltransferase [Oscillospiraceae bacterium]|jgi:glucose-1-phosphate adenylyltransferase|nr:glucose-1-phosphate adenylyltransferase [Oscillospiraceae bacterium]
MQTQECIAMLLAGGQGSRLGVLTRSIAKPAVPFGGKYRIIDFPLSNCTNSGIDTVGVLTQYQPLELNDYIGSGQPWDLDRMNGGVHILSPYQQMQGTEWYKGTANAIYQNIHFIDRYNPEYVLILSGDHIYKMDYSKMLDFHKKQQAACTIAMLEVPWEEASRFGLMLVNDDGSIAEFEEKPKNPRTNKASMGVYVFDWKKLRAYLIADEQNPKSSNDFGKDVIPAMHGAGERLCAYAFDGYWKDVGTIDSLWEANLDLLNPNVDIDLSDPDWRIYSRSIPVPPHYLSEGARVQNSMVSAGCVVEGEVDFSILFPTVTAEPGAVVRDSILMPGVTVQRGAQVHYAIVAENTVVAQDARVGARPEEFEGNQDAWGVAVVGAGLRVGPGAVVPPQAMIENDVGGALQ